MLQPKRAIVRPRVISPLTGEVLLLDDEVQSLIDRGRYEFAYDEGGLGKGGAGTIFVNGKKVAEGRIDHTQPKAYSADEGADVGEDGETPVVEDYGIPAPYKFTGKIAKVTVELQGMKKADKDEEDKSLALAAHKKKLSD